MIKPDSRSTPRQAGPTAVPARILVADDDDATRCVVVEALREAGYAVSEVHDGGRLLVALAQEYTRGAEGPRVDVLVSDIKMPICTGLQILEQLHAANSPIRVILMTASADEYTRARARSCGAILLDKPFDAADLRSAVALLLRGEAYGRAP